MALQKRLWILEMEVLFSKKVLKTLNIEDIIIYADSGCIYNAVSIRF